MQQAVVLLAMLQLCDLQLAAWQVLKSLESGSFAAVAVATVSCRHMRQYLLCVGKYRDTLTNCDSHCVQPKNKQH